MSLKNKILSNNMPNHIGIILDGNGRWARRRGLPRTAGHKAGVLNLKRICLECSNLGIKAVSVYAFSTENWKRPKEEVDYLMSLPKAFNEEFKEDFKEDDIRVIFSGRRDRFSQENTELLHEIEEKTKDRQGTILNICFDYGSRFEMLEAVKSIANEVKKDTVKIEDIDEGLFESYLYTKELPPLDLMIRTSGEIRISNFLLWQLAYSELYFPKCHWPAFNERQLYKAILNYQKRNRRFGGLKEKKK